MFEKGWRKAALEAKKQGKVRFIGFMGHQHPAIHLKMLGKPHSWDTAQMPIPVMDAHYRSFQKEVVPLCLRKNTGGIGMKGLGGGNTQGRLLEKLGLTSDECYRYCLSLPIRAQVMGITSMEQLKADVKLAREFRPMSAAEMDAFRAKVRDQATDGRHELFQSGRRYDGVHHRRQHGFST